MSQYGEKICYFVYNSKQLHNIEEFASDSGINVMIINSQALTGFNSLFTLRYSAPHQQDYKKIYRLDAMDAYNMKLVKKIGVKGITVKGATGTEGYLYHENVKINNKHSPTAHMEYEEKTKQRVRRVTRKFKGI